MLFVLQFRASDYLFGIFKFFRSRRIFFLLSSTRLFLDLTIKKGTVFLLEHMSSFTYFGGSMLIIFLFFCVAFFVCLSLILVLFPFLCASLDCQFLISPSYLICLAQIKYFKLIQPNK